MLTWRCPHCGTPQTESARCWVCRRSSTSCATCRHFRRSVAVQLGFCGLDPRRLPLSGDEIRGCWEAAITPVEGPTAPGGGASTSGLDFVPVEVRVEPPAAPSEPAVATGDRYLLFDLGA